MNPISAPSFLRACRARSTRTLALRPSAPFNTERQLLQCQRPPMLERRPRFFSTSSAAWNSPGETTENASRPATTTSTSQAKTEEGTSIASSSQQQDTSAETPTTTTTTTSTRREPPHSALHWRGSKLGFKRRRVGESSSPAAAATAKLQKYRAWAGADLAFVEKSSKLVGTVTRTGTMRKTVRVSRNVQVWDAHLQKHYTRASHALVHDPDDLLVEGDVVSYVAGFPPSIAKDRLAKGRPVNVKGKVNFTVVDVLTPFGQTIADRLSARAVTAETEIADVRVAGVDAAGV